MIVTGLVYKEFVQAKAQILQALGLMAIAALFAHRIAEDLATPILFAVSVALAMTLPQTIFDQEERGNTFVFLRALPIRPGEIVAAKYVVSAATTTASMAVIGLASVSGCLTKETAMAYAAGIGLLSFVLSALSLFLHFLLGSKSAKTALMIITAAGLFVGLFAPMVLATRGRGDLRATFGRLANRIAPVATSYAGVMLSLAAGFVLLAISFSASARIFAGRDLSRLP